MSVERSFTKENLDQYLKELAKELRKINGTRVTVEMIMIGGASILVNYGFREMTYDVDAIIRTSAGIKEAINAVGDRLGLPNGWLNTDFMKTESYTPRLIGCSKYYKTFSNILQVRTVSAEYLIAMKLMAGRQYKNDLSDVIGILLEQEERDAPISYEKVKGAVEELYGSYERIPERSREFIESIYAKDDLRKFYLEYRHTEIENKELLIHFQGNYPGVLNEKNLSEILKSAKEKKQMKESGSNRQ